MIDWLARPPHVPQVWDSIPGSGPPLWSLHDLPVLAWGFSAVMPHSQNMHSRLMERSQSQVSNQTPGAPDPACHIVLYGPRKLIMCVNLYDPCKNLYRNVKLSCVINTVVILQ